MECLPFSIAGSLFFSRDTHASLMSLLSHFLPPSSLFCLSPPPPYPPPPSLQQEHILFSDLRRISTSRTKKYCDFKALLFKVSKNKFSLHNADRGGKGVTPHNEISWRYMGIQTTHGLLKYKIWKVMQQPGSLVTPQIKNRTLLRIAGGPTSGVPVAIAGAPAK